MTALEKLEAWLAAFPDFELLSAFQVDYTDHIPIGSGALPPGLEELERRGDISGGVEVVDQYNFGIYAAAGRTSGEGPGTEADTGWLMSFRQWVQDQSVLGLAPAFGDEPGSEKILAGDRALYEASDRGAALTVVRLSVQFKKKYEV